MGQRVRTPLDLNLWQLTSFIVEWQTPTFKDAVYRIYAQVLELFVG